MKKQTQKLLFALLLLSVNLFFCAQKTEASAAPTEEQIQQYQEDGSLQERIQYYEDTGSDEFAGALIQKHSQSDISTYNSLFPESFLSSEGLMPSEGNARILLLRVNFPDKDFDADDTLEALQKIAFDPADENAQNYPYESLSAYYERASYGKLHISGDVADYTAQHERSYYDNNINSLFVEALDALDSQIDFSQYDGNQDGFIDGIYLHFAGMDTGWGSSWWSVTYMHSSILAIQKEYDGKQVGCYATLHAPSNTKFGAQTLIHETGHLLGLPDYYHSTQIYESGMRSYDMMFDSRGDFNGFSKWLLGWISEDEILRITLDSTDSVSKSVTLNSFSKYTEGSNGYKLAVVSPSDEGIFSEYFVIEYDTEVNNQSGLCFRQNALPDGFRIFHVNATLNENKNYFAYNNISADTQDKKFIEALDKDQTNGTHNYNYSSDSPHYTEVAGTDSSTYNCNYVSGDILDTDTTPSTQLSTDAGEKKADISIRDFSPQGDTGTLTITMNAVVPSPDDLKITIGPLWKDIEQSNLIVLPVELSTDATLNPDASPVLISSSGDEIPGRFLSISGAKNFYLIIQTDYLEKGDYTLKLPEGTFDLGQGVGSYEQQLELHVEKNMQIKSSGTMSFGIHTSSCASSDNGWYFFSTDETQTAHLYKINTDGTMIDHVIDFNTWADQFHYTPVMSIGQLTCLQDGTLALTFNAYTAEGNPSTILVHMNENGELLNSVDTLSENNLSLSAINNTLKISKQDTDGTVLRLWSTDFKSELKEIPIDYTTNHYVFLKTGYLVLYLDNDFSYDKPNITHIDYRNANDESVRTYQFSPDSADQTYYPSSTSCGFETSSDFYFIVAKTGSNPSIIDRYYLTDLSLKMYILNKETGEFQIQTLDSSVLRYSTLLENLRTISFSDVSENDGKVFFSIYNQYTYYDAPFTDNYCLNLDTNTIESRISTTGYGPHTFSGNYLLTTSGDTGSVKYTIYECTTSAKPADPDTPKDPESPKDPGSSKNPENSKDSGTSKVSVQKNSTAKTGDSTSLIISFVLLALSFTIICILYKRKKNTTT